MKRTLLAILAALLAPSSLAAAPPDPEARIRELSAELEGARAEIERLRPSKFYVYCERSDLERPLPSIAVGERGVEAVLNRLSVLGVDPVYETRDLSRAEASAPGAYLVRAGCSFLGGDRITEVNGIPIAQRDRVAEELRYNASWRFTVDSRSYASKKTPGLGEGKPFEMATLLGVRGTEATMLPASSGGEPKGFMAKSVSPNGLMARAGLREGDLLLMVNGAPLAHATGAQQIQKEWKEGGKLFFVVERNGLRVQLTPLIDQAKGR
jgi:hypothetical protein